MTAAAKKTAAAANTRKSRAAAPQSDEGKEVNILEALPGKLDKPDSPKSLYPKDVQTYAYQPKDGSDPILLPLNGFDQPNKVWHFDVSQMSPLAQTWAWMRQAKVPNEIQRRCQFLDDGEYFAMFDEWFGVMRQLRGAGPKGAVTAGK